MCYILGQWRLISGKEPNLYPNSDTDPHFCNLSCIPALKKAGVYILQNTMVVGGGMAAEKKN